MNQTEGESSHVLSFRLPAVGLALDDTKLLKALLDNLIRPGEAVGNGGRVGPTGRPMMTQPPLSDDGY